MTFMKKTSNETDRITDGIHRRRFLLSVLASTTTLRVYYAIIPASFAITSRYAAAQQALGEIHLTGQLRSQYKKLHNLLNWIDWAENAIPALIDKRDPEPPPGPCGEYANDLDKFTSQVDTIHHNITLPRLNYNDLRTQTLLETRYELAQKFRIIYSIWLKRSSNNTDILFAELEISAIITQLTIRLSVLDSISKIFLKIAEIPLPVTYYAAVQCFGAIELTYRPKFLKAIDSLEKLHKRVKIGTQKNDILFQEYISEHRNFLALESFALDQEAGIQTAIESKIASIENLMDIIIEQARISADSGKKYDAEVTAYEYDIEKLSNDIVELNIKIDELVNGRDRLEVFLRKPYNRCPNRKSYNECTHEAEKRGWREDRAQAKRNISVYSRDITDYALDRQLKNRVVKRYMTYQMELNRRIKEVTDELLGANREMKDLATERNLLWEELEQRMREAPLTQIRNANLQERRNLDRIENR